MTRTGLLQARILSYYYPKDSLFGNQPTAKELWKRRPFKHNAMTYLFKLNANTARQNI